MKCLLIRTTDKREYLTVTKNYPLLIEYANTFNAKIYTVEVSGMPPVLGISELAEAICEGDGINKDVKYRVLKKHMPAQERASKRKDEQKLAGRIRDFIKEQLLKGKPVSLMSIRQHFARHGLRTCTLSNHYAFIRRQLTKQGVPIKRVGHGIYQRKQ